MPDIMSPPDTPPLEHPQIANLAALVMAQVEHNEPDIVDLVHSPNRKRKRLGDASPSDIRRSRPSISDADLRDDFAREIDAPQAAVASVNVSDFNALQEAAAGTENNDVSDPVNASTTAAAALVYPTIHAPPQPLEDFAAQLSVEQDQQPQQQQQQLPQHQQHHELSPYPHETSHDGYDHQGLTNGQHANGIMHQDLPGARYANHSSSKPAVGSEEWHKMRKDSHKEGECRRVYNDSIVKTQGSQLTLKSRASSS